LYTTDQIPSFNLPGTSSVEICPPASQRAPHPEIFAISGENTAETVKAAIETGIGGFISKQQGGELKIK